jgi:hypothetical protein
MTRRNWFALLAAPFLARFRPKPPLPWFSVGPIYVYAVPLEVEEALVVALNETRELMMQDLLANGQASAA